jgi:hypothetical protein
VSDSDCRLNRHALFNQGSNDPRCGLFSITRFIHLEKASWGLWERFERLRKSQFGSDLYASLKNAHKFFFDAFYALSLSADIMLEALQYNPSVFPEDDSVYRYGFGLHGTKIARTPPKVE